MNKLFPARLTICGLISHLQTINSSHYAWSLNVHCYTGSAIFG